MPCYYTGTVAGDDAMHAREVRDELTRMLCATWTAIDARDLGRMVADAEIGDKKEALVEAIKWWYCHKEDDAKKEGEG